ncbi:MAG: glycosyltransferase [Candidatus Auribacter fodinae]|uniref:Glycosyltransferase n=1 Tax=Candidatus Auribacter fodinae TaxID=2093366 RepID=A0A3A4QVJ2_9BACT|nr:MAG: glycosyltransferase [Candidatus Auribacter fodinae]
MLEYILLTLQLLLLAYFTAFGLYNYVYSIASLFSARLARTKKISGKVAVVIVSFNEKEVITDTISSCEKLTYPDKTIIVGDDSNDGITYPLLKKIAREKKCVQNTDPLLVRHGITEVHESPSFVVFHRHNNEGFKAGNLKELERYLLARGYEYLFLLDADYHPQKDVIEKSMEVLLANPSLAYVQSKREYSHPKLSWLQHCLALNEESCYFVDLPGRQKIGDPILFTGCCTLFRLDALVRAEGFRPGHLTEDIDLTNRLYLLGLKGAYLGDASSEGEVPPDYRAYRKQQERWTMGTAHTLRDYFLPIITSKKISIKEKMGLLRQDLYYSSAVAIELSIILSLASLYFLSANTDNYAAVHYRLFLQTIGIPYTILLFAALASNFAPLLITCIKKREWRDVLLIPYATWLSWSLLHTLFWANIKGFLRIRQNWFLTPKTNRKRIKTALRKNTALRTLNGATLALLSTVYFIEWAQFGWLDPYALFWIPALTVGTIYS